MRVSVDDLIQIAQNKKLSLEEIGFIVHLITMPESGKGGRLGFHELGFLANNTDFMVSVFHEYINKGYIKVGKRRHVLTKKYYDDCNGLNVKNEKTENKKTLFVYLMHDESTGLYKIGKSYNPSNREKTLCAQIPLLRLLHKTESRTPNMEKSLHKKYANKRVRGEWFNLTQEEVEYIKSL
jgi:hypothetical protein